MARTRSLHARIARCGAVLMLTASLGACIGGPDGPRTTRSAPSPQADLGPAGEAPEAGVAGARIGTGSVKVALVVPLTGQGAALGTAMRNAAELAMQEFQQ